MGQEEVRANHPWVGVGGVAQSDHWSRCQGEQAEAVEHQREGEGQRAVGPCPKVYVGGSAEVLGS